MGRAMKNKPIRTLELGRHDMHNKMNKPSLAQPSLAQPSPAHDSHSVCRARPSESSAYGLHSAINSIHKIVNSGMVHSE